MHCTRCGREAPAESRFCPQCGTRLAGGRDVPEAGRAEQAAGLRRVKAAFRPHDEKQPEELDLWHGTYSPKALAGPALAALVLTGFGSIAVPMAWNTAMGWSLLGFGVLAMWGMLALMILYRRLSVHYRLTTYRLFHESGLLSRTTDRIEAIDIDDVRVHQGLIERLLGVGTVRIRSSDQSDPELKLPGIEEVRAVADLIDDTRRAERERRGMHIEAI
jgi:membrane protein YdbS with pleckstrin-like domain